MRYSLFTLSTLLTSLHALTITSPTSGSSVDPSKPITVRWTSSPSDPTTINLFLSSPSDNVFRSGNAGVGQVGSNIPTSSGTYTIPANKVAAYGSGFIITANGPTGDNIASSGSFQLGYGLANQQVVTGANGQLSLVPAQTSLSSITFESANPFESVTATFIPGSSQSGPMSSLVFTTGSVTGSMTIQPTRSGSSSASGSGSRTSSSAGASATSNNQPRLRMNKEVLSVAGLLAGVLALVA